MAPLNPYTYIQCPCSEANLSTAPGASRPTATASTGSASPPDPEDDDKTFDPRAPRANFSLFPLEYLLFCEDCLQIRCPRCVAEEIVTYYCPSCLFEVPSSNLKSEGNRCNRSCFQCPVCIGPLSVTSIDAPPPDPNLLSTASASDAHAHPHGPYVLMCSYCNWSSTEAGIQFDKANGIHGQLAKLRNGGIPRQTAKERKDERSKRAKASSGDKKEGETENDGPNERPGADLDVETQFANLKHFYTHQIHDGGSWGSGLSALSDLGFASPTSLTRIMNLYAGTGAPERPRQNKPAPMREALNGDEGLRVADLDESAAIAQLGSGIFASTTSTEQTRNQPPNIGEPDLFGRARFASELRPIPYLLRTKRSKRCPACRHILSKPEAKVQTTRFRIRLVAGSWIPTISIRPLPPLGVTSPTSTVLLPDKLQPLKPVQYLLTFRNPIFETVRVTLATPATTPGRFSSKVTVLCPQFEIDANTDVWDEALKDGGAGSRSSQQLQAQVQQQRRGEEAGAGAGAGGNRAEAGKIWERGRNWVSVAVEIVPASLRLDMLSMMHPGEEVDTSPLKEDEDVLEIPMFVRVEWTDAGGDEVGSAPHKDKDAKEKRELAYWCVLGIGRISRD